MRQDLLTDRLILRDVTVADAELLADLDSDPEVVRYVGTGPATDAAWYSNRVRTFYLPMQQHPWHGMRIVLDRASGEFLGWVFVRPANTSRDAQEFGWSKPDEVEVGFRYRRSAWGRGFATEAAMPLVQAALADPTTTAVVACAAACNARSLRVLEKLGLRRVGEAKLANNHEPVVMLARARESVDSRH